MNEQQKLDPEFKAKWVAALRSGEYKQCKGALHLNGGHCCLGVAEMILGLTSSIDTILDGDGFPEAIKGGRFENSNVETLTSMNDGGFSFPKIADYIEKNL